MTTETRDAVDIAQCLSAEYTGEKPPYIFGDIKRRKDAWNEANPDGLLLDCGIGEPPLGPDQLIRDWASMGYRNSTLDGYPDLGLPELREAAMRHMAQVFGVTGLNAEDHFQDIWGIKHALTLLADIFCMPGQCSSEETGSLVAVTSPGYPVFATRAQKLGAEVIIMELSDENGFVPKLPELELEEMLALKAIYLISPHNPTGVAYNIIPGFWEEIVAFCRDNCVALIVDEAYAHLHWQTEEPFTALSVPGFIDVGVVLHSGSKTLSWTGGRTGFIAGNAEIIKALRTEYEDSSSGSPLPNQWALAQALNPINFTRLVSAMQTDYRQRLVALQEVLLDRFFPAVIPDGGFFILCPAPVSCGNDEFEDAKAFMEFMLDAKRGVVTVPFGKHIRFSACTKVGGKGQPATYKDAMKMLADRLPPNLIWA